MKNANDELDKEIKNQSIKYLLITLFFIMLPYIVKVFLYFFTNISIDLAEDFINGGFFMYAISLLAPIWYTVETVFKTGAKKGNNVPVTETLITIIVSVAVYVILSVCYCASISITIVPMIFASIGVMGWSIYLAFKIHKDEITVTPPDENRIKDENTLKSNIEKLEKGEHIEISKKGISGELDMTDWEEEDEEYASK